MKRIALTAAVALLCTLVSAQDTIQKRSYCATFTSAPPIIDGSVEDEAWQAGLWDGDFIQYEPQNGAKPSQQTSFKILFDDNNIYVAIKAYDTNPDSIVKRISRRDNGDGDFVGISFDSYHDRQTGFTFLTNAAGVKNDFMWAKNGQIEDETWDPIWFTDAQITDWGWSAEMKIPLTQLRFRIADGGIWGLELFRQQFRNQEMSIWQHIDRNASGLIFNFGELTGLTGIRPRKQADITPFVVGSLETFESEEGNPFATGRAWKYNAGLDAKFGVTNNMTLDLTVNPDFGQVEADPSEVNLTAYETFFEEKRPFFIEGNNITSFRTGIGDGDLGFDNLFYSRRIGRSPHLGADTEENEYASEPRTTPIISAIKLTGKTPDGLSVGIVEAVTAEVNAEIDSLGVRSSQTVEPLSNYFVSRVMKDFGGGKTVVGGAFTNTHRFLDGTGIDGLVSNANTAGVDFSHYFGEERSWFVSSAVAGSNLSGSTEAIENLQYSPVHYYQRPDADYIEVDPTLTSLNGFGGNVQTGKVGGHWNFMAFTYFKSPGFDLNDAGYLQSADAIISGLWSAYRFDKPFSIFRQIRPNANYWTGWDFGGTHLFTGGNLSVFTQFKNLWWTSIGGNYEGESLSNTILRGGPSMLTPSNRSFNLNLGSNQSKMIYGSLWINRGKGGEDSGERWGTGLDLTAKPGQSFSVTLSPSYSKNMNTLQYVTHIDDGDHYILSQIDQQIVSMSVRLNYNITPDFTIQYWGQPFLAAMDYSRFKEVTDPMAEELEDRYHEFTESEITLNEEENRYYVDDNNDGISDYSFDNPDYNYDQFLSNLVARWEFRPGSILYLVWSQTRSYYDNTGSFSLEDNLDHLYSEEKPYNVFLIKFTYRFGLR
ncbi:hydrolase [bacterium]|nr:hydrolase [bacterium]